MSAMFKQRFP
jgi:hypothetical protein